MKPYVVQPSPRFTEYRLDSLDTLGLICLKCFQIPMYVRTGGIPVTYQCGFRNWSLGGLLLHLRESGMKFVGGYLIFSLQVIVHYRVVSDVCIGLLYGTGCAPSARWGLFAAPRDMSDLSRFSLCSLSFLLKPWWMRLPW